MLKESPVIIFTYVAVSSLLVYVLAGRSRSKSPNLLKAMYWLMASLPFSIALWFVKPLLSVGALLFIVIAIVFVVRSIRAREGFRGVGA